MTTKVVEEGGAYGKNNSSLLWCVHLPDDNVKLNSNKHVR